MLEIIIILAVLVGFFFLNRWIRSKKDADSQEGPVGGGSTPTPRDGERGPRRPNDHKPE